MNSDNYDIPYLIVSMTVAVWVLSWYPPDKSPNKSPNGPPSRGQVFKPAFDAVHGRPLREDLNHTSVAQVGSRSGKSFG